MISLFQFLTTFFEPFTNWLRGISEVIPETLQPWLIGVLVAFFAFFNLRILIKVGKYILVGG